METIILHLLSEIYLIIGRHLPYKSIYSCIQVCHSIYSAFIPHFWANLDFSHYTGDNISPAYIRANAQYVENTAYTAALTVEYYSTVLPCLHTL